MPKLLQALVRREVYVAGPNRVVARDLYNSCVEAGINASLQTSDATTEKNNSNIRIMAHQKLAHLILRNFEFYKNKAFIIDEFHDSSPETVALCKIVQHLVNGYGAQATFMSATSSTEICRGTNYLVEDIKIKEDGYLSAVRKENPFRSKGVLIVSGNVDKNVQFAKQAFPGINVIPLSRDYIDNMSKAANLWA